MSVKIEASIVGGKVSFGASAWNAGVGSSTGEAANCGTSSTPAAAAKRKPAASIL